MGMKDGRIISDTAAKSTADMTFSTIVAARTIAPAGAHRADAGGNFHRHRGRRGAGRDVARIRNELGRRG